MSAEEENFASLVRRLREPRGVMPETVELEDESKPDGAVVFRYGDGSLAGMCSRAAYEALLRASGRG